MADDKPTTVQIQAETWQELNRRKKPGDTFDDVIQRLLHGEDESSKSEERARVHEEDEDEEDDAVEVALRGWSHGRNREERAINQAIAERSLRWLRERGRSARKMDVPLDEWASEDELERSADGLWEKVVRDAWQHTMKRDFISQPKGRHYEWSGKE